MSNATYTPRRLGSLTSLRFVAAGLVVVYHSGGHWGFPIQIWAPFALNQSVDFFFILSGFILTYVYPTLEGIGAKHFWRARVARIWPAHLSTFALLFLLVPHWSFARHWADVPLLSVSTLAIGALNLGMLHAWIPLYDSFWSFNLPSWSISDEFAFYLLFPFLISNWRKTWVPKLVGAIAISILLVASANVLHLPAAAPDGVERDTIGVTVEGLLGIHPLAHLHEFVLGMTTALAWMRWHGRFSRGGLLTWTIVESVSLGLACLGMYSTIDWSQRAATVQLLGPAGGVMVGGLFSTFAFALLIFVFASDRGAFSRMLVVPPLLLLGEISYSIYLLHGVILRGLVDSGMLNVPVPYFWYWTIVIGGSFAMWRWIERPLRQTLAPSRRNLSMHDQKETRGAWPPITSQRNTTAGST